MRVLHKKRWGCKMKTEVAQLKRQFYHKQNEVNRNFHVLRKS
jgi:hypothetical protein